MTDGRIVVSGLSKYYIATPAVDDLSFEVEPGRVTGLLGPKGAGKTTTFRMLLSLVAPTAGTATIGGHRYVDLADPVREVGAMLAACGAHPARTARNHLRILAAAAGVPASRVDEVLALVGLTPVAKRKLKTFWPGMWQRLGIAAAMLGDPRVLLLDEPASGLNQEEIRWLRGLLRWFVGEGRTVLVSSHLLPEVELLADELVLIAGGQFVTRGTVASVRAELAHGSRVRPPWLAVEHMDLPRLYRELAPGRADR